MKTYDVVHYDRDGERTVYLEELEDLATAQQHAAVIGDCTGQKVIVEETPQPEPVKKKGFFSELGEIIDMAIVMDHMRPKK